MASTNISAPALKLEVSNYQDRDDQLVILRGYSADNYPTLSIHMTPSEAAALVVQLKEAIKTAVARTSAEVAA